MSWQATTWVIEHSKHKGSNLLVMLMIANCANEHGQHAFPSIDTLARDTRLTSRQVNRIIPRLEESGEITVHRTNGRKSNVYEFPLMNPVKMSGLEQGATLTSGASNPDISNANPDIAMSPDPSIEQKNSNKPPKPKKPKDMDRDEFVAYLKTRPEYAGVPIEREIARAATWIEMHPPRQLTRSFIVNWLNKVETPLPSNGNGHAGKRSREEIERQNAERKARYGSRQVITEQS